MLVHMMSHSYESENDEGCHMLVMMEERGACCLSPEIKFGSRLVQQRRPGMPMHRPSGYTGHHQHCVL